jgi:hypothetical protein
MALRIEWDRAKKCFDKYDVEVPSLEGTYLRTEPRRTVGRGGRVMY